MLLLQFLSFALTFRKPVQEHFSQLKRVNHRCYFGIDTHRDLNNLVFVENSNSLEADKFVMRGKIIDGMTVSHLTLGSFRELKKVAALVDTGSQRLVVAGNFEVEPLTRAEANIHFKSHINEYTLLQICPTDFENFFCTEANYGSASYLTAVAKTEIHIHKDEVFSVLAEFVIGKTDHSPEYFKDNQIISIVGAGYRGQQLHYQQFLDRYCR